MSTEVGIVLLLVGAWSLQIWMSSSQMRRFNKRSHELRGKEGLMAVGLAGGTYRRKIYSILVTDASGTVTAAEQLTGFTVFANTRALPNVVGLAVEDVGIGPPPVDVSAKAWASLGHAAGFIRSKLQQEASVNDGEPGGTTGGDMT